MTNYSWMNRGVRIKAPDGNIYTIRVSPRQVYNSRGDDDGWRVQVEQLDYPLHCQGIERADSKL